MANAAVFGDRRMASMPFTVMSVLAVAAGLAVHHALAQETIQRHDVMRHGLELTGREVIQVRVDIPVGAQFGRHSHPGPEIAYVLEGAIEYRIDGRPPVTLQRARPCSSPLGAIHAARNVGTGGSSELATYIVETGKPILTKEEYTGLVSIGTQLAILSEHDPDPNPPHRRAPLKVMQATDAKNRFGELLEDAISEPVLIQKNGRDCRRRDVESRVRPALRHHERPGAGPEVPRRKHRAVRFAL